jgi:hypothetical protein
MRRDFDVVLRLETERRFRTNNSQFPRIRFAANRRFRMRHVRDACLLDSQPVFDFLLLRFDFTHLIAQLLAKFNKLRPFVCRGFGNSSRRVFLLTPQVIAASNQGIAFVPQANDGVDIGNDTPFATVPGHFVPMIADELQIQHLHKLRSN